MNKPFNLLTIGIFLAGLLGGTVLLLFRSDPVENFPVTVVVAAQDLPFGTKLDQPGTMLASKQYPRDLVPVRHLSNPWDAGNRVLIRPLEKGAPCSLEDSMPEPPGKRLVTVKVTDVIQTILPDSRLDILTAVNRPDDPGKPSFEVFVRNAVVVAVDKPTPIQWLLLLPLTPDEAEELARRQERGEVKVQLSRRWN